MCLRKKQNFWLNCTVENGMAGTEMLSHQFFILSWKSIWQKLKLRYETFKYLFNVEDLGREVEMSQEKNSYSAFKSSLKLRFLMLSVDEKFIDYSEGYSYY
jgi:hypothetical protein